MARVYLPKPMEARLEKVIRIPFAGCWIWIGALDKDGYGRMRGSLCGKIVFQFAHRASYEFHEGPIPTGAHVCHRCDTPSCINPHHLYLGNPATNGRDKKLRGRARTTPQYGPDNGMFGRVGELNPFYGKTHTAETRARLSHLMKEKYTKVEP